jgi:hypothetical protein
MARKQKKKNPGEMLFLAGLFGGLGIGFLYDQLVPGIFIGMAVGFIAAFFYATEEKKKK